ncbi:hypothetical protein CK203_003163 [Vitis vinifera]|uniref:Uncharacterized protein n=1 Tax=Vitis vinifera TaxID=29760 RepID=A0A438K713_VITVI|nr:hypothetical protein CK203_003163 [Vitis vinifera]
MPKLMLVVSAELKNIAILQPQDGSDDETINYFFKLECEYCGWISEDEACVSITVKEKPTGNRRNDNPNLARKVGNMIWYMLLIMSVALYLPLFQHQIPPLLFLMCQGCERRGEISLIPGHGAPLSQNHCTEVDLMLFHCDGLLPVKYSFNGGWLATTTSGREIHVDLTMGEFTNVIDGMEVSISKLKAKFVPYWG